MLMSTLKMYFSTHRQCTPMVPGPGFHWWGAEWCARSQRGHWEVLGVGVSIHQQQETG